MSVDEKMYFTAASMIIAVPRGLSVLLDRNHVGGSITSKRPCCSPSASCSCLRSRVTGVVLANGGVDTYMQDTYYVVAHFHYVLSLGAVFAIFAGFYYWFPEISGRMYNELLGRFTSF